MLANLRNLTHAQLLQIVHDILAEPRPLSLRDKAELLQVNDEFTRRDAMRLQRLCHYCYKPMLPERWECQHCGAI